MATSNRTLLGLGPLAGPFYLALGLGQALTREGFDLSRHALSALANGPGGWVQTANFVLTGAMVVAAAVGIRRALSPEGRAASVALAGYGLCMLAAAIFPADPVDGFPVGTPAGMPSSISSTGMMHFVFGGLAFLCLGIACFLAAGALSRHGLSRLSMLTGLVVLLGFLGGMAVPSIGVAGIWLAVVAGWAWLTLVCLRLRQEA